MNQITLKDYTNNFYSDFEKKDLPLPGEHHFVSVFLLPLLYKVTQNTPDYVNPDGTKDLPGDIIYNFNKEEALSIEVKYQVIRLTKKEYNDWIVKYTKENIPDLFIGFGSRGMLVCNWEEFVELYKESIGVSKKNDDLSTIKSGYGPTKSMNVLIDFLKDNVKDYENVSVFDSSSTNEEIEKKLKAYFSNISKELV